jgi:hypothetical protein
MATIKPKNEKFEEFSQKFREKISTIKPFFSITDSTRLSKIEDQYENFEEKYEQAINEYEKRFIFLFNEIENIKKKADTYKILRKTEKEKKEFFEENKKLLLENIKIFFDEFRTENENLMKKNIEKVLVEMNNIEKMRIEMALMIKKELGELHNFVDDLIMKNYGKLNDKTYSEKVEENGCTWRKTLKETKFGLEKMRKILIEKSEAKNKKIDLLILNLKKQINEISEERYTTQIK